MIAAPKASAANAATSIDPADNGGAGDRWIPGPDHAIEIDDQYGGHPPV
jgi:hypothetical protein